MNMVNSSLLSTYVPRRLPVIFMLDTSLETLGTYSVALRQGPQIVMHELRRSEPSASTVQPGFILFGETTMSIPLQSLISFHAPSWDAYGKCHLQPAIAALEEVFMFDLIESRPDRPGDYHPLIFFLLGSKHFDGWKEFHDGLSRLRQVYRPLVISLVIQPDVKSTMKELAPNVFWLRSSEAEHVTNFFYWAAQYITKVCEDCTEGKTTITLHPSLPTGITRFI